MSDELASQLLGSWRLRSWTITDESGERSPFGPDPVGRLIYSADRQMAAQVARADRPPLSGRTPRRAADTELAAAMLSFFAYSGSWWVEGDVVLHEVHVALNPAMVGSTQRREIELSGDVLTLSADESTSRGMRRNRLVWISTGLAEPDPTAGAT